MSDPLFLEMDIICSQRSAVVGLGVVPKTYMGHIYFLFVHMSLRLRSAEAETKMPPQLSKLCPRVECKLMDLESVDNLGFLPLYLKYCGTAAKL